MSQLVHNLLGDTGVVNQVEQAVQNDAVTLIADSIDGGEIVAAYNENVVEESNRPRCRALVAKVKSNLTRMLTEAIESGESLKELHAMMSHESFVALCNDEFKISHSTAWRYMKAHDYVIANYSADERLSIIPRFNLSAIEFLATSKEIISPEQVKELADSTEDGKLVSRKALESLIAELESKSGSQLAQIEDLTREAANANRKAEDYRNQAVNWELSLDKTQRALGSRTTEISGLMQEIQDKEKKLAEMRKQLDEKNKPIAMLPAEYANMEEAIQKKEGELDTLKELESKLKESLSELQAQIRVANGAAQDSKSLQAALMAFIHDLQMLTNKHDASVIGNAFKAANDKTKDTVLTLIAQVKQLDMAVVA